MEENKLLKLCKLINGTFNPAIISAMVLSEGGGDPMLTLSIGGVKITIDENFEKGELPNVCYGGRSSCTWPPA